MERVIAKKGNKESFLRAQEYMQALAEEYGGANLSRRRRFEIEKDVLESFEPLFSSASKRYALLAKRFKKSDADIELLHSVGQSAALKALKDYRKDYVPEGAGDPKGNFEFSPFTAHVKRRVQNAVAGEVQRILTVNSREHRTILYHYHDFERAAKIKHPRASRDVQQRGIIDEMVAFRDGESFPSTEQAQRSLKSFFEKMDVVRAQSLDDNLVGGDGADSRSLHDMLKDPRAQASELYERRSDNMGIRQIFSAAMWGISKDDLSIFLARVPRKINHTGDDSLQSSVPLQELAEKFGVTLQNISLREGLTKRRLARAFRDEARRRGWDDLIEMHMPKMLTGSDKNKSAEALDDLDCETIEALRPILERALFQLPSVNRYIALSRSQMLESTSGKMISVKIFEDIGCDFDLSSVHARSIYLKDVKSIKEQVVKRAAGLGLSEAVFDDINHLINVVIGNQDLETWAEVERKKYLKAAAQQSDPAINPDGAMTDTAAQLHAV